MSEFDLDRGLRWLRRKGGTRPRRTDAELAFLDDARDVGGGLLLDTCVYIDQIRMKAPEAVDTLVRSGPNGPGEGHNFRAETRNLHHEGLVAFFHRHLDA